MLRNLMKIRFEVNSFSTETKELKIYEDIYKTVKYLKHVALTALLFPHRACGIVVTCHFGIIRSGSC